MRTGLIPSGLIWPQFEVTVKKLAQGAKAQTVKLKLDEDQLESVKDLVEKAKEAKKDSEDR